MLFHRFHLATDHLMVPSDLTVQKENKTQLTRNGECEKENSEAKGVPQVCSDCTDWDVFRTVTNNVDE